MLQLRDYQVEAVEAVEAAWERGIQRPLLSLPTGCGKTIVFAEVFRRRPGRGLVLAHREELLEQARDKIRLVIPEVEVGIVKAERDEHDRPLVVASVQTLSRPERLSRLGRDFLTLTVDEAHHAAAPSYRRVIGQLGGFHPDGPLVLGVTATPERGDHASLAEVWQEVVYRREILEMIRAGHLCDLQAVRVRLEMDLDRVQVREGDFVESELAQAMSQANAPRHALEAYQKHAEGRKTLIFTPTVALAHEMAETFAAADVAAAAVDGETPIEERRELLSAFRTGDLGVLANCALLTEGYDEPSVDCLILARPTRSRPFYVQMLGRGTRKFPGKSNCLVIDLVGASRRHRLLTVGELFGLGADRATGGDSVLEVLDQTAQDGAPELDGRLVAEVVDLFAERELHWSCGDGLYVLSAGRRGQVVLREEKGAWTVSALPAGSGLEAIAAGLDLGYAQGVAEDLVRRWGADSFAQAEASWRGLPATPAQLNALAGRGLAPSPEMTRGQASDLLNVASVTAALAPATSRQIFVLRQLGVALPNGLTKRQASQLIDQAKGGGRRR
ncbi:MAG: DEAD/DEAH box helicase [Candidatus Dormibacteraeota bacterium]|nr:DEAD/DEAH box helicase [Candidatus Dormibacteraeota bacterium]